LSTAQNAAFVCFGHPSSTQSLILVSQSSRLVFEGSAAVSYFYQWLQSSQFAFISLRQSRFQFYRGYFAVGTPALFLSARTATLAEPSILRQ
jgi:hypothetical protein